MKHFFAPLLIASALILMSMSGCNDWMDDLFNHKKYSPVSAEINGVRYYSDGFETMGPLNWPYYGKSTVDKYEFSFIRELYSEQNDSAYIKLSMYKDTIITNTVYTCKCGLGRCKDVLGKVKFSTISTTPERLIGTFEFVAEDPYTGDLYEVKNGTFDIYGFDN